MPSGGACPATPADRLLRGVVAVIVAAFALTATSGWCAVPAFLCAGCLAFGAITGWCPTDVLRRRPRAEPAPNRLGYPEARHTIDV